MRQGRPPRLSNCVAGLAVVANTHASAQDVRRQEACCAAPRGLPPQPGAPCAGRGSVAGSLHKLAAQHLSNAQRFLCASKESKYMCLRVCASRRATKHRRARRAGSPWQVPLGLSLWERGEGGVRNIRAWPAEHHCRATALLCPLPASRPPQLENRLDQAPEQARTRLSARAGGGLLRRRRRRLDA